LTPQVTDDRIARIIMENMDKLEEMVTGMVRELHRLREDNQRLEEDNRSLQEKANEAEHQKNLLDAKSKRVEKLEDANRKFETEQSEVRSRVKNLLDQLEKINFA